MGTSGVRGKEREGGKILSWWAGNAPDDLPCVVNPCPMDYMLSLFLVVISMFSLLQSQLGSLYHCLQGTASKLA